MSTALTAHASNAQAQVLNTTTGQVKVNMLLNVEKRKMQK